ncbi:MAG TPA: metalloprotease [Thermoplasmata archaeon]|nr:metalloprotease [Thermoplasmata archaeon]
MSWGGSFQYSWTPPAPSRRVTTSKTELLHLGVAYAVLTGCLLLVFSGNTYLGSGFAPPGFTGISVTLVVVAALAALTGFVAHEMAHKIVAQRLGFWAEFRASPYGLIMAAVTSFLGFILAAPGATMVGGISGIDRSSWGRTSLAGPMTNVTFAAVFYVASIAAYLLGSVLFVWLLVLAFINAWFGTFNLFPFGVLDGRKVFLWSRGIWAGAIALTLTAMVVTVLALYVYVSPLLSF